MKYSISEEEIVFNNHYKIIQAEVVYDTFKDGEIKTKRFAFERGDSVAILLLEKETQSILMTNQFRYPSCKHNEGWLLEIPAGTLEANENPVDCITREVMEELGYNLSEPKLIQTFYTSPGGSTERIFLYFAKVSQKDKIEQGGGLDSENEDIQMVKIPVSEIAKRLPEFKDAKTILAMQWFLLNG